MKENPGHLKIKVEGIGIFTLTALYATSRKNVCYWSFIDGETFKKLTGVRSFNRKPPTIRVLSPVSVLVFDADVKIGRVDHRRITIL